MKTLENALRDEMKTSEEHRTENLKNLRRWYGGEDKDFARAIGVSPSQLSQLLAGKPMGKGIARRVETNMKTGRGWMDNPHGDDLPRQVKVISWSATGGNPNQMKAAINRSDGAHVRTAHHVSLDAFALRIRDDSMFDSSAMQLDKKKSFALGDIIIVDPTKEAENGSLIVARLPGSKEAIFKQLSIVGEERFLKPLNPRYPITLMPQDAVILGVAVEKQDHTNLVDP